jgi:hypothetical protein
LSGIDDYLSNVPFKAGLPATGDPTLIPTWVTANCSKLDISQKSSNGGAHVATVKGEGGGDFIDRPEIGSYTRRR